MVVTKKNMKTVNTSHTNIYKVHTPIGDKNPLQDLEIFLYEIKYGYKHDRGDRVEIPIKSDQSCSFINLNLATR